MSDRRSSSQSEPRGAARGPEGDPPRWTGSRTADRARRRFPRPKASAMPRSSLNARSTRGAIVAHTAEVVYQTGICSAQKNFGEPRVLQIGGEAHERTPTGVVLAPVPQPLHHAGCRLPSDSSCAWAALRRSGGRELLNSEAITEAIRPFNPPSAFGARHWHTLSTYARHRIRHGIRYTAARAGRRSRQHVQNDRLRHRLIGSARVSTAAGSQSLAVPCDALQAAATRDLSSPSGFPPVRQYPSIWSGTECGRLRTLPY